MNLDEPDSLQFSPDGRMFISERITGNLRVATYDTATDTWQLNAQPFYTFDTPKSSSGVPEGHRSAGLRDIAFDPDFATNGFIYAFYMPNAIKHNRVVRIKASTSNPNIADSTFGEELLLEMPFNNEISTGSHNGGALEFGDDGTLFISTGDGWEGDYPGDSVQSLSTFTGKIFRINSDGTIPTDNPFYGQTSGDYRAIFALGLRNPYSMAKHPTTGSIYINEARGTNKAQIYVLEAAANYGHEGYGVGNSRSPWADAANAGGQLVTGGAWYPTGGPFPSQYHGSYFTPLWGGNNTSKGKISRIRSRTNISVSIFEDNVGASDNAGLALKPVMTRIGPRGDLYYLLTTYETSQGSVQRVSYTTQQTVQTPILSPAGGNYQSAQNVNISTPTAGASIHYTTDGSEPSLNSPLYSGAVTVSSTAVVKAKAFRSGFNPSSTASEAYSIGSTGNNIPPDVDAGPDQTVPVGATVTLNGSGSTDPDGNDELLSDELWTQLSGPPVNIVDATEEIAYFTPTSTGTYEFRLEMSDGIDTGFDDVIFTVVDTSSNSECNGNVLSNSNFESGTANWNFHSSVANWTIGNPAYEGSNAAKISVNGNGNTQLYQFELSLQPYTEYRLSFMAYSSTNGNIEMKLHKHGPSYGSYVSGNIPAFGLTSSWATYSHTFTTANFSSPVNDARLRIWLSNVSSGDYWFDAICLTEVSNLTPSTPGTPALIEPQGTISTDMPNFSWSSIEDVTNYEIVVYDLDDDNIVFSETYPTSICSGNTCSTQISFPLAIGDYTWLVRASNNGVFGDWATFSSQ